MHEFNSLNFGPVRSVLQQQLNDGLTVAVQIRLAKQSIAPIAHCELDSS